LSVVYILAVIFTFGLIVLIHELGHFIAAKKVGVRVVAFSFGFGPYIGRKWGETEYRLSLIPFGGYLRMAGEQTEAGREPKPDELFAKTASQRALVFVGGVTMNLVLGLVAFIVAYGIGVPVVPAVVGDVRPAGPAWRAGLRQDDCIVSVNGRNGYVDFEDLKMAIALADPVEGIRLGLERPSPSSKAPPEHFEVALHPEYDEELGLQTVGIDIGVTLVVGHVVDFPKDTLSSDGSGGGKGWWSKAPTVSPARDAGIELGDRLVEINGRRLERWEDVVESVGRCRGEPLTVHYVRDGRTRTATVKPVARGQWLVGVACRSLKIEVVRPGGWADRAGLRPGDVIQAVRVPGPGEGSEADAGRDRAVRVFSEFKEAVARARAFTLGVARQGETFLAQVERDPRYDLNEDVLFEQGAAIDYVIPGFPAERAGIRRGDRLLAVGDKTVTTQKDMTEPVTRSEGKPILVKWEREGAVMEARIAPERRWLVGIGPKGLVEKRRLGLVGACVVGTRKAVQWVVRFFGTLRSFATRRVATRHLGGPVSIFRMTYEYARHGPGSLCYWIGLISVNLALFNLLPLPVLDGGHLLLTGIEKIKGSPVSERIQAIATYVGLALILSILFYATWNDIVRRW